MTILVTGATANIGRKVVDQLLARGITDIRALTNNPRKAALPAAVQVAEGNVRRPETLSGVFDGVDRMYLAPASDSVVDVLALARAGGVRHVVDLSGEPESWWGDVSGAVEKSGLAWTHLWPADFMENSLTWSHQIRTTGTVREPHPEAASAPIAMVDIAAVAATALSDDSHIGHAYSLAGPEVLTRTELVSRIAAALGRDITFERSSREDTIAALTPTMGETATWYVDNALASFDQAPAELPITSVPDITGSPATTFARWALDHAADFGTD
ncbi:NAD(P)H-binding protein [Nocardia sp. SYP-A9097]|uniref:SDR family oxidoreductase n=1 Tax=Nocardia sp. SYP-A9097 TaxID=2663237 RepID=UPI00129B7FC2|nr:NAD(P)H-binding protein [Nocardia sp. SYP-A9097]MRH87374.1 NAD(P)H-binding protein [Nocardia sp. SYP-A9097]